MVSSSIVTFRLLSAHPTVDDGTPGRSSNVITVAAGLVRVKVRSPTQLCVAATLMSRSEITTFSEINRLEVLVALSEIVIGTFGAWVSCPTRWE